MKSVAFFNNKGGIGKTQLVYHLSWMLSETGLNVLALDFDPQAQLTRAFLRQDRLEEIWPDGPHSNTAQGFLWNLLQSADGETPLQFEQINSKLHLLPGDLALSAFEETLASMWLAGSNSTASIFSSALHHAASKASIDIVLIDMGPNFTAINRSALAASDHVVVPISSDPFSLQNLLLLGERFSAWRSTTGHTFSKPRPAGYVLIEQNPRANQDGLPQTFREALLKETLPPKSLDVIQDPYCLATLQHYRSLMPLAMEARKPMFHLKPADGAIGAHVEAVRDCYRDFKKLANRLVEAIDLKQP